MNQAQSSGEDKQKFWEKLFLKKWHPVPTVTQTILLFAVIGIIFIIIGIIISVFNSNIQEQEIENYQNCSQQNYTCLLNFTITEKMKQPIFLFYYIENFYQNHRRYIKSKNSKQLAGEDTGDLSSCDPITLIQHINDAPNQVEYNKNPLYGWNDINKTTPLPWDSKANPCGLIAKSVFNDTYELFKLTQQGKEIITIKENGIAWPQDIGDKFKQSSNSGFVQWINPENEHFIVWMRTSGLPDFRKLWGRIENDLEPGQYQFNISNNYNVDEFKGSKSIVLSTSGPLGGKNKFLAIAYIVVGSICILISAVFCLKKKLSKGKFGDKQN